MRLIERLLSDFTIEGQSGEHLRVNEKTMEDVLKALEAVRLEMRTTENWPFKIDPSVPDGVLRWGG